MPNISISNRNWNKAYKNKHTPWRDKEFLWLNKKLRLVKNKTALDLGCGTGEASHLLSAKGYKVTGIDFSKEALKEVSKKIKTVYWDLEGVGQLGLEEESYDLILDSKVLAFIRNKNQYLKIVSHILKKNGKFIIQGFLKNPKKHICLMPKDLQLIRKYFEITKSHIIIGEKSEWFVYILKRHSLKQHKQDLPTATIDSKLISVIMLFSKWPMGAF
ncbi:MAG: class I SAM-dependent methyltransferase [Patescibacteria group bacterium]